jgi:Protein of unknown function (DUF3024)
MAIGPPPEVDVVRIQRWCEKQVPAAQRDRIRIECEVSGRDVTIVERHPLGASDAGTDWVTTPAARLRYLKSRTVWRLYWCDSDDQWHEYPELPFAHRVDDLLAEIDRDPTALFWG